MAVNRHERKKIRIERDDDPELPYVRYKHRFKYPGKRGKPRIIGAIAAPKSALRRYYRNARITSKMFDPKPVKNRSSVALVCKLLFQLELFGGTLTPRQWRFLHNYLDRFSRSKPIYAMDTTTLVRGLLISLNRVM
jgi:hypothetical protein